VSKGRLISFEGLDGAGKTTQIELLEHWLKSRHISYVRTREPGGTELGMQVRRLVLSHPDMPISPLAEAFLFQADRAEHCVEVILPALEEGKLVITDRFFDASIAYQGYARGVGVRLVKDLSLIATQGRIPDLTILLDLNPKQVHKRVGMVQQLQFQALSNGDVHRLEQNRLDIEAQSFHQRVSDGFKAIAAAKENEKRIEVVDASKAVEKIHEEIVKLVSRRLKEWSQENKKSSQENKLDQITH
jgi:dTMP kinase